MEDNKREILFNKIKENEESKNEESMNEESKNGSVNGSMNGSVNEECKNECDSECDSGIHMNEDMNEDINEDMNEELNENMNEELNEDNTTNSINTPTIPITPIIPTIPIDTIDTDTRGDTCEAQIEELTQDMPSTPLLSPLLSPSSSTSYTQNTTQSPTLSRISRLTRNLVCAPIKSKPESYLKDIFTRKVDFKNLRLQTQDNVIIGAWLLKPVNMNEDTKFSIILHGNASDRHMFCTTVDVESFVDQNNCVLIPDYRGFGDSEGEYTIEGVNLDIDRCFNYLAAVYRPRCINLIGYSLGTAAALEYHKFILNTPIRDSKCSVFSKIGKTVLIGPFVSLVSMYEQFTLWKMLCRIYPKGAMKVRKEFNYESIENIKLIGKEDVVIFHGVRDGIVPYSQGLELANSVGCKIYRSEGDDHISLVCNNGVWKKISEFLGS